MARRRMTATPDTAAGDPQQTIAQLQRQLDECRAELASRNSKFDVSLKYQTATRFAHPPPRWGRARVGVVMPRTDPW
jgi:hypothetical protein